MADRRSAEGTTVNFTMQVPVAVKKDRAGYFVSCCPALDVFSQGPSEEAAVQNLVEALQYFFLSCYERGTLDRVLRECGFKPAPSAPERSEKDEEMRSVNVPLPYQIAALQNRHV